MCYFILACMLSPNFKPPYRSGTMVRYSAYVSELKYSRWKKKACIWNRYKSDTNKTTEIVLCHVLFHYNMHAVTQFPSRHIGLAWWYANSANVSELKYSRWEKSFTWKRHKSDTNKVTENCTLPCAISLQHACCHPISSRHIGLTRWYAIAQKYQN